MKTIFTTLIFLTLLTSMVSAVDVDNSDVYEILEKYEGSFEKYVEDKFGTSQFPAIRSLSTCIGCTECSCTDTDPNDYLDVVGVVGTSYVSNSQPISYSFTDVCALDIGYPSDFLIQVSCDKDPDCDFPIWIKYDCACTDGTCKSDEVPEFGFIGAAIALIGAFVFIAKRK